MKILIARFVPLIMALFVLVALSSTIQPLMSGPNQKQAGKANNKKKTAAQKKKEMDQRKKARERAEAERKRKIQEEVKRKQAIEAARQKRLQAREDEAKEEIGKCSIEAKGMDFSFQKMLEGREMLHRCIRLMDLKSSGRKSAKIKLKLNKIEEQFKSKGKDLQGVFLLLEKIKNSDAKTQKGGNFETWEKTLLEVKRELTSISSALKSGQSSNKSLARLLLGLIPEYVQAGIEFSEEEKKLIKKLTSL